MSGRTIVLSANSDWNIANFRGGLIRALQAAGYEPVVIAPPDPAASARMEQFRVVRAPIRIDRSGLSPAADLKLLQAYRRLLRQLRPAAYLSFTIKPNIYGSLAASSLNIPAIPNVSGLGTAFMKPGLLQHFVTSLYRRAFRRLPTVFFQNAEDRALFVDRRIVRTAQARVIPGSGVDLQQFTASPVPQGPPTFLLVGRLLRDKGVLEFVEAARSLRPILPSARFQLLGPLDAGNRTAISSAELTSWIEGGLVEYLGATQDVRPFVAAATAVVLPSYREGLPRSLLEASAMGRPLVATDVPGCRQVVEHGYNGFLCAAQDAGSLAGAMQRLAAMPLEEQRRLGEAARRKVQDEFDEKRVTDAYLEVVATLTSVYPTS